MKTEDAIKSLIIRRISDRVPLDLLYNAELREFYIGGNSLNSGVPNDLDIFPCNDVFSIDCAEKIGKVVSSTKNAYTVLYSDIKTGQNKVIQLCNYNHDSLKSLVDSFDFAHIQIGAYVKLEMIGSKVIISDSDVYCTEDYISFKILGGTEYVGSEYPLSSLMRLFKYHSRGDFSGRSHIYSVIKVINDILERKFNGYEDFKDQLDAVDLGLVPEELQDADRNDFMKLFELLNKM